MNKYNNQQHNTWHVRVALILFFTISFSSCEVTGSNTGTGGKGDGSEVNCDNIRITETPTTQNALLTLINKAINDDGNEVDLNYIDISQVTDISGLFVDKTEFNGDVRCWDVSAVTSMRSMFQNAEAFNRDLSNWQPLLAKDMARMFYNAKSFNSALFSYVDQVEDMESMFEGAVAFNQDLSAWDTGSVMRMTNIFNGATSFNAPLFADVTSVESMINTFKGAKSFCQDLSSWGDKLKKNDQGAITVTLTDMFTGAGTTDCDPSTASPPFLLPPQWWTDATS